MFIKNDDYESAALEAFRNKDIDILKSLLQKYQILIKLTFK